ncbi:uncharacterized protein LOC133736108 [Rosa rugosa]|uniref:uncharacterized protein LOC133736108 n=1 Tax=Rosa rugosa TaxID=74645 RepID=UPI002B40B81A|nr:uncharacterized protein LOC133736108 [Rosa rugosa]
MWLPDIVSSLQSAYVLGRLISDNTLVANEAAHFMHKLRYQEEGFFSLKLDISKAYDRLEWSFISAMLTKLGFDPSWIQIIMKCVTSVAYSILLYGEPSPRIAPTQCIRQGDPLSPYLFILCSEGLSPLISQAVQHQVIQGLKMCPQAPTLHHLFFPDDSILFGFATMAKCMHYKRIHDIYENASGQKEHDKYLGLPMKVGRSKSAIFAYIKEKLTKKLVNWKAKILSAVGKEILIKAMAQTMPFWERLCLTKDEGGMGFKNVFAYNLAMLAKQGWRLLTNPNSLIARLYKARYYPNNSFWEAELGDSPSFSWRSILQGRPVLKAGVQWCIGDGTQVNIWNDRWIPDCQQYLLHKPSDCVFELVSDLIDHGTRTWMSAAVYTIFPPDIAQKVVCIPVGS